MDDEANGRRAGAGCAKSKGCLNIPWLCCHIVYVDATKRTRESGRERPNGFLAVILLGHEVVFVAPELLGCCFELGGGLMQSRPPPFGLLRRPPAPNSGPPQPQPYPFQPDHQLLQAPDVGQRCVGALGPDQSRRLKKNITAPGAVPLPYSTLTEIQIVPYIADPSIGPCNGYWNRVPEFSFREKPPGVSCCGEEQNKGHGFAENGHTPCPIKIHVGLSSGRPRARRSTRFAIAASGIAVIGAVTIIVTTPILARASTCTSAAATAITITAVIGDMSRQRCGSIQSAGPHFTRAPPCRGS